MNGDFIVRGYQPGDEHRILEMFNEVFGQRRTLDHWYWKYRDHPWGAHRLCLAEASDGVLAAHYGGYPVRVARRIPGKDAGEDYLTYHLGDKMSRPRFRNAGLRRKGVLPRAFYQFRENFGRGVPYGYGFTTHHSLRIGLLLLDYMDVEPVGFWRKPVIQSPRRNPSLPSWLRGLRVEEARGVDEQWTAFFHRVADAYHCLTVRDAAYLQWRYLDRPDRNYLLMALRRRGELAGWSAFCRSGDVLEWVDALFDPAHAPSARTVLETAVGHPMASGVREVTGWFPARPAWWAQTMERLGFARQPEPLGLHLSGPVFADENSKELLATWYYYTKGDGDLC